MKTAADGAVAACTYTPAGAEMGWVHEIFTGFFAGIVCGLWAVFCLLFVLVLMVVAMVYGTCALLTAGACCLSERKKQRTVGAAAVAISIEQPLLGAGSVQQYGWKRFFFKPNMKRTGFKLALFQLDHGETLLRTMLGLRY